MYTMILWVWILIILLFTQQSDWNVRSAKCVTREQANTLSLYTDLQQILLSVYIPVTSYCCLSVMWDQLNAEHVNKQTLLNLYNKIIISTTTLLNVHPYDLWIFGVLASYTWRSAAAYIELVQSMALHLTSWQLCLVGIYTIWEQNVYHD